MGYIRLEKDSDGIVDLVFRPAREKPLTPWAVEYDEAIQKAIVELEQHGCRRRDVTGIYVKQCQAQDQFFRRWRYH